MESWTVKDLVTTQYKGLGVPHFQRGLVWGKDAVARLLESLFYDTPCGTLILWKPINPIREGIKLPGAERLDYLIIDGQQRIRSIHDALAGLQTESAEISEEPESEAISNDSDNEQQNIWCLNLTRIPELIPLLDSHLQSYPLFMKVTDPQITKNKRFKYNLVPLRVLLKDSPIESISKLLRPAKHKKEEDIFSRITSIKLLDKAQKIRSREFQVIIKVENDGRNCLSELVQIYNRINSGGVRVESEERAFAALVSMRHDTNTWLHDLFTEFHSSAAPRDNQDQRLDRDDILQRTKEKNFGFKLFMRTFVQSCSFHCDQSLGSSSFSFDSLNRPDIQNKLRDPDNAEKVEKFFRYSRMVLSHVWGILRDDLYCDSFQFLPETTSFIPVFQLLLKYPELVEKEDLKKYRPLLRLAILKLMLANLSQRDLLDLVAQIRRTNTLEKCASIIRKVHMRDLTRALKNSNSLQDRYVLLLYWLERKHGVRDFSYKNLKSEFPYGLKGLTADTKEVPIEKKYGPEKQHIVPYSVLEKIYSLTGRSRISSHPVNNIGNISYISHALNSYEGGLGAQPINWRQDNDSNLRSHFLLGVHDDRNNASVLKLYDEIINASAPQNEKKIKYEEFCAQRINLIEQGFSGWLHKIEQSLPTFERIEPIEPLFMPTKYDKVRKLDYDDIIKDSIYEIMNSGATTVTLKEAFAINIRSIKKPRNLLLQLRLKPENIILKFNRIDTPLARDVLAVIRPEQREANESLRDNHKIPLPVHEPGIEVTEKALQVIANFLKDSSSGKR